MGLFFLAELLAPFIFSLFFSNVKRERGRMNRARSSAEKNRPNAVANQAFCSYQLLRQSARRLRSNIEFSSERKIHENTYRIAYTLKHHEMNSVSRTIQTCVRSARYAKYSTLPSEAVIFAEDDRMVICWHPEKPFPYECSLPLPEEKPDTSVLCIGDKDVADVFRKKKPYQVVEELAKVTYTTKHRWYPRSRDKKAKDTEPDRPYL